MATILFSPPPTPKKDCGVKKLYGHFYYHDFLSYRIAMKTKA